MIVFEVLSHPEVQLFFTTIAGYFFARSIIRVDDNLKPEPLFYDEALAELDFVDVTVPLK